jgi:glycolate oxidase FAD binding subunit
MSGTQIIAGFEPHDEAALIAALGDARTDGKRLEIIGAGTRRGLGRPVDADALLATGGLSGITWFDPGELAMEAGAGTPLAEIEAALAEHNQHLAFEPGDMGPIWGATPGRGTIGGVFACNLSGPRRPFAGAARDHLLGLRAVSGRGELFVAGGRVVKNVTGYDMAKLMAGSFGTLAVLSQVTFRVAPRPAAERTVLLMGVAPHEGLGTLNLAAGGVWDITAGAHLGRDAAARSAVPYLAGAAMPVTLVRLEGDRDAVAERCAGLRAAFGEIGPIEELHTHNSRIFWSEMRDGRLLPDDRMIWRLSLPPADAAFAIDRLADATGAELLFDWLGGLVWLSLPPGASPDDDHMIARRVHDAAGHAGGQATLWRASDDQRRHLPVFGRPDPGVLTLTRRIKGNFDPAGILNPGRMYPGQ